MLAGLHQRNADEIHTDMTVATRCHMRSQQARAAAQVDKERIWARRLGYKSGTGRGDPMEHGERAVRAPPLSSQSLVLSYVVAKRRDRHALKRDTEPCQRPD